MLAMSDPSPRRFRVRIRTLLLLTLLAVIGLSIYSYWSDYVDEALRRERELLSPPRGAYCTVVLRRELLGLERMNSSPAKVDGISNHVSGEFVLMNDEWIVLEGANPSEPQQWIPREHVLLLRVATQ
jgi:hypothetical protein